MTLLEALQAALATEHAVVYGYGLVGARLAGPARNDAQSAYDAHRARRDLLAGLVRDNGGTPVAAAPAYSPPAPVTDAASAIRLAVHLEEGSAAAAYDLVGASGVGDVRRIAVGALQDAAVRAARWRRRSDVAAPSTTAFPGRP